MNWNFFSIFKPSSPKLSDATDKMRETIDLMEKRKKHVSNQAETRRQEAKKCLSVNDKRGERG